MAAPSLSFSSLASIMYPNQSSYDPNVVALIATYLPDQSELIAPSEHRISQAAADMIKKSLSNEIKPFLAAFDIIEKKNRITNVDEIPITNLLSRVHNLNDCIRVKFRILWALEQIWTDRYMQVNDFSQAIAPCEYLSHLFATLNPEKWNEVTESFLAQKKLGLAESAIRLINREDKEVIRRKLCRLALAYLEPPFLNMDKAIQVASSCPESDPCPTALWLRIIDTSLRQVPPNKAAATRAANIISSEGTREAALLKIANFGS